MRIVYMTNGLPHPGNNGVPMLGWALVKFLLKKGHQVTVIGLCAEGDSFCTPEHQSLVEKLGAKVAVLPYKQNQTSKHRGILGKLCSFFDFSIHKYFPSASTQAKLGPLLNQLCPEAIIAIHNEPLAALWGLKTAPCLGIMGDPSVFPIYYGWRYLPANSGLGFLKHSFSLLTGLFGFYRWDIRLLKNCASRGALAAHYTQWFKRNGVADCEYYRIPVFDEATGRSAVLTPKARTEVRPHRIVLLGGLRGTATRIGLRYFFENSLYFLNDLLGSENFEVRIIGGGEIPPELKKFKNLPSVKFLGYVQNITDELLNADVFLVPTPIDLGIRVRILTAFSYGLCIVAHSANAAGIPELIHEKNCLLAKTGSDLAKNIARVIQDPPLRHLLMHNARETYEKYFSEEAAGGRINAALEAMLKSANKES